MECELSSALASSVIAEVDLPPIHRLTTEILEHIFSFLSLKERLETELVCKRWRTFGKTVRWKWPRELLIADSDTSLPSVTVTVRETGIAFVLDARNIPLIIPRCGQNLERLVLHHSPPMNKPRETGEEGSASSVQPPAMTFSHASKMLYAAQWKLENCPCDPQGAGSSFTCENVKIISTYCSNIVEFMGVDLTQLMCEGLLNCCTNLKAVAIEFSSLPPSLPFGRVSPARGVTNDETAAFIARCTSVESLCLYMKLHSSGFLTKKHLACVNPKLKRMHVDYFDAQFKDYAELTGRCDSLEELSFSYCRHLNEYLVGVTKTYENTLVRLGLNGCTDVDESHLCQALQNLKNLKAFSAQRCNNCITDVVLKTLATNCANLEVLDITLNTIEDRALAELAAAPRLKTLYISKITGSGLDVLAAQGILEQVTAINSVGIKFECLAKMCPNFRKLDASGTKAVTYDLVEAFRESIQSGFLKHRVQLIVGGTLIQKAEVEKCDELDVIFQTTKFKDHKHWWWKRANRF